VPQRIERNSAIIIIGAPDFFVPRWSTDSDRFFLFFQPYLIADKPAAGQPLLALADYLDRLKIDSGGDALSSWRLMTPDDAPLLTAQPDDPKVAVPVPALKNLAFSLSLEATMDAKHENWVQLVPSIQRSFADFGILESHRRYIEANGSTAASSPRHAQSRSVTGRLRRRWWRRIDDPNAALPQNPADFDGKPYSVFLATQLAQLGCVPGRADDTVDQIQRIERQLMMTFLFGRTFRRYADDQSPILLDATTNGDLGAVFESVDLKPGEDPFAITDFRRKRLDLFSVCGLSFPLLSRRELRDALESHLDTIDGQRPDDWRPRIRVRIGHSGNRDPEIIGRDDRPGMPDADRDPVSDLVWGLFEAADPGPNGRPLAIADKIMVQPIPDPDLPPEERVVPPPNETVFAIPKTRGLIPSPIFSALHGGTVFLEDVEGEADDFVSQPRGRRRPLFEPLRTAEFEHLSTLFPGDRPPGAETIIARPRLAIPGHFRAYRGYPLPSTDASGEPALLQFISDRVLDATVRDALRKALRLSGDNAHHRHVGILAPGRTRDGGDSADFRGDAAGKFVRFAVLDADGQEQTDTSDNAPDTVFTTVLFFDNLSAGHLAALTGESWLVMDTPNAAQPSTIELARVVRPPQEEPDVHDDTTMVQWTSGADAWRALGDAPFNIIVCEAVTLDRRPVASLRIRGAFDFAFARSARRLRLPLDVSIEAASANDRLANLLRDDLINYKQLNVYMRWETERPEAARLLNADTVHLPFYDNNFIADPANPPAVTRRRYAYVLTDERESEPASEVERLATLYPPVPPSLATHFAPLYDEATWPRVLPDLLPRLSELDRPPGTKRVLHVGFTHQYGTMLFGRRDDGNGRTELWSDAFTPWIDWPIVDPGTIACPDETLVVNGGEDVALGEPTYWDLLAALNRRTADRITQILVGAGFPLPDGEVLSPDGIGFLPNSALWRLCFGRGEALNGTVYQLRSTEADDGFSLRVVREGRPLIGFNIEPPSQGQTGSELRLVVRGRFLRDPDAGGDQGPARERGTMTALRRLALTARRARRDLVETEAIDLWLDLLVFDRCLGTPANPDPTVPVRHPELFRDKLESVLQTDVNGCSLPGLRV